MEQQITADQAVLQLLVNLQIQVMVLNNEVARLRSTLPVEGEPDAG